MAGAKATEALPVLFAACDEVYFRKHGKGFCASGLAVGHVVHVLVSPPPGPSLDARAQALSKKILPKFLSSFSVADRQQLNIEVVADERAHAEIDGLERIVFYQSLRFFHLPSLLRRYQRPVVVLDIDSLVRSPIPARVDADVGLYLRLDNTEGKNEEERLGKKVLGAMVYASPSGIEFFEKVATYIDSHDRRYFVDQRALFETYLTDRSVRYFDIAEAGWLDWSFSPAFSVWTAKGKRKRRNLSYVRERLRLENRGAITTALTLLGYRLKIIRR